MSYLLGYITADGCIFLSKGRRKNPYTVNITSKDRRHLYKLRNALRSQHKIGKKSNGSGKVAFQLAVRNFKLARDLMRLGVQPRKTYHLEPIKVPKIYFADFVRGFFDGDGSVYIYKVNEVPQIKAKFVSTSLSFVSDFNQRLCKNLNINEKTIHSIVNSKTGVTKFTIDFYIDDCMKLMSYMYGSEPQLYLQRKYRIFQKWRYVRRHNYRKQNYPSKIGWHLNSSVITDKVA